MPKDEVSNVTVAVGDETVVIRRSGQSSPIVANILGVDRNGDGVIEAVWLDRLVHNPGERKFVGWDVSGAISTILRSQQPVAPAAV